MKILIYDVETAQNKNRGSICAVGWISLNNDHITGTGYSLIDPQCSFSRQNTEVHGIKASDVSGSPCFAEYWESTLRGKMSDHLVIAHNALFDITATQQALYNAGLEDPGIDYMDSLAVFRRYVDTDSCKLTYLAELCGYEYNAHNALEDCKALLYILHTLADRLECEDLSAMLVRSNVMTETTADNSFRPKEIADVQPRYPNASHCKENVEVKGCLFAGMRFCITGDIPGYERADVERLIMEQGGKPTSGVSGKTNYLIVGKFPDYPADFVSIKQKTALELVNGGGSIQIISPEQFFSMLANTEGI